MKKEKKNNNNKEKENLKNFFLFEKINKHK
jgi:hypothetical protein